MIILQQARGVLSSGGFDPIAARYIRAVETAGATVTAAQRDAISSFFKDGRTNGWISSMRRIYLPIWGLAAPNAIDMLSISSGTFVGNVSHQIGFTQTVAPTGHFLANGTPTSLSLTANNSSIFSAVYEGEQEFMGCAGASNSRLLVGRVASVRRSFIPSTATGVGTGTDSLGILMGSRGGNITTLYQRKTSGWINPETITNVDTTALPLVVPAFLGNFNNNGTITTGRTGAAKYASYGYGLSLSSTNAEKFTLALKNLWETCTGLTLP